MKNQTINSLYQLRTTLDGKQKCFILDKIKVTIGSHPSCDIQLDHPTISSYHAFFCFKGDEGILVKDLCSESGIFIDGQRVEEAYLWPGNTFALGNLIFNLETCEDDIPAFIHEPVITHKAVEVQVPALPKAQPHFFHPEKSHEALTQKPGMMFIDGEFCNVTFDESNYRPLTATPEIKLEGEYLELDETREPFDLCVDVASRSLEVISYVNGLMSDVHYLELKDGDYYLSPMRNSHFDIQFTTYERSRIISVKNNKLEFHRPLGLSVSDAWDRHVYEETLFLTNGSEQVSLRLTDKTVSWKGIPFYLREMDFFKLSGVLFFLMFMPTLLLFLSPTPEKEPEVPELVVIYKVKKPQVAPTPTEMSSELAAVEPTSKTEDSGHKENIQPAEKVEFQESSAKETKIARSAAPHPSPETPQTAKASTALDKTVTKPSPAQSIPTPVKNSPVAVVDAPTPEKAIAKPTPYSFKSSSVTSLVSDVPTINGNGAKSSGLTQHSSFNSGTSDDGELIAGSNFGVSKLNGSDKKGNGSGSFGSRGLASKKGFDTAYLEPSKVVKGSMDPELLRRILREYIPQFRHCYQQELATHSETIKGVVDLNFTINANGKVSRHDIQIKDAKFSADGVNCMGKVLSVIDFPKPKGGGVVDVTQPLNFAAETSNI